MRSRKPALSAVEGDPSQAGATEGLARSFYPWLEEVSPALEILHRALMFLRRRPRRKRSQILPLPRLRILLAGIQTILAGLQFANHAEQMPFPIRRLANKKGTLARPHYRPVILSQA